MPATSAASTPAEAPPTREKRGRAEGPAGLAYYQKQVVEERGRMLVVVTSETRGGEPRAIIDDEDMGALACACTSQKTRGLNG